MVQIVEKEEKSTMVRTKLKFVYSVILLAAVVVVYMLVFGEDGATRQSQLIYTDVNVVKQREDTVPVDTIPVDTVQVDTVPVVHTDKVDGTSLPPTSSSSSGFTTDKNNFVQQQSLDGQQTQQAFEPSQQNFIQQPAVQPAIQPAQQPAVQPEISQADTSQCPELEKSLIHDRITESCEIDRFKNNWIELVSKYDIPSHRLLYDVDRNYVWVTVPKIASSNIKRVIIKEKLGFSEDSVQMKEAMEKPHIYLSKCCLLTEEVARMFYSLQRAFTFTFIRNPWTRLYSAYQDKIVLFKGYEDYYYIRKILFTVREWSWEEVKEDSKVIEAAGTITFTDFLTMLSKTDAENYNDHWKPWFLLTQPCLIKYDYIGYLEDISTAYQVIKEKAFSDLDIGLDRRYETSSGAWRIIQAYKSVPRDILDIIYNKFEDDFKIGGYSRDIDCIAN